MKKQIVAVTICLPTILMPSSQPKLLIIIVIVTEQAEKVELNNISKKALFNEIDCSIAP